jgi:hypothetical protein
MGLGLIALLFGMGAAGAGAALGLSKARMLVELPGGMPAASPETMAIAMLAIGTLTMVLGVMSMYRANED